MKHAFSAPLVLLVLALAGCAADRQQAGGAQDMSFATETKFEEQVRQALAIAPAPPSAASERDRKSPAGEAGAAVADPGASRREAPETTREQYLRRERLVYAQGLERILLANGLSVGVLVYEGQAGPTPTLMFVGSLSRDFVHRAATKGAVLERARALGFRSVDFFDRGPDSHYQFVLSKDSPLPKCAAYNRLCL
jgi:hypothetical protein